MSKLDYRRSHGRFDRGESPMAALDISPRPDGARNDRPQDRDSGVVGVRDGKGMGRSRGGSGCFLDGQASMDLCCGPTCLGDLAWGAACGTLDEPEMKSHERLPLEHCALAEGRATKRNCGCGGRDHTDHDHHRMPHCDE